MTAPVRRATSATSATVTAGTAWASPAGLASRAQAFPRPLDAAGYVRHAIHGEERAWPETNCYLDLWVEALHARGLDPVPLLGVTLAMDWEGDQYTFVKVSHEDLFALYGVDVQELTVWKPLLDHALEQVAQGRLLLPEVDGFWLPDTAGVSHRVEHTKTTIGIQMVDAAERRLGYFHNAGYHELSGDDFDGMFHLGAPLPPEVLPTYTEIAKLDAAPPLAGTALDDAARRILARSLARAPRANPVARHRATFARDLEWLREGDPTRFHQYAFATFRQLGAGFELAATLVRWLDAREDAGEDAPGGLGAVAAACDTVASTAKMMQFKLARAVTLRRPVDFDGPFDALARAWDEAMTGLATRHGA